MREDGELCSAVETTTTTETNHCDVIPQFNPSDRVNTYSSCFLCLVLYSFRLLWVFCCMGGMTDFWCIGASQLSCHI